MSFYILLIFGLSWLVIWGLIIFQRYHQELKRYWLEPILKYPVLIFESDDWGAGPLVQSHILKRIAVVLGQYTDKNNHHPIMTLAVILSIPDSDKIKKENFINYYKKKLDNVIFSDIKTAMLNGMEQGVFDLQLHGMAHYWPDNLMRDLSSNKQLQHWLTSVKFPCTELLPDILQSRWINNQQLPTTSLTSNEIEIAVREEVHLFANIFGFVPTTVVPPTFIWNDIVERSWKKNLVKYLVTPGQYFTGRDSEGKPSGSGEKTFNGQTSKCGLTYLVRNDYFEPSLGHTVDSAIKALDVKTKLAQPTLFEIHRFNFIQDNAVTNQSLDKLESLVTLACERYSNLVFLSSAELADMYLTCNEDFIEKSRLIQLLPKSCKPLF